MIPLEKIFQDALPNIPLFNPNDLNQELPDFPDDEMLNDLWGSGEVVDMPRDFDSAPLPVNEIAAIGSVIRSAGIDVLAFYKSYRLIKDPPFKGRWGIFYTESGINYLAHLIRCLYPHLDSRLSAKIALDFLHAHEVIHGYIDLEVLSKEFVSKKSIYLPQKYLYRRCRSSEVEEALANQNAYKKARSMDISLPRKGRYASQFNAPNISEFFYDFMKLQPGAYSRFDEQEYQLKSEVAAGYYEGKRFFGARCDHLSPWVGLVPNIFETKFPQHLVIGIKYSALISPSRFIPRVKVVNETKKFMHTISSGHQKYWEAAKSKLISESTLPGLDFKLFYAPDIWSIRVNLNFRAHLTPIDLAGGVWEANEYGAHTKMGHG
jgi:hypothetical protein